MNSDTDTDTDADGEAGARALEAGIDVESPDTLACPEHTPLARCPLPAVSEVGQTGSRLHARTPCCLSGSVGAR
ncbi:hypothetical protein ACFV2U_26875 [Streptomyces sp. NPDC059697]|uniref:hypothetical protein n=1 Tax=Streptomyces sp. NPDC059697 TaxID=3346912 RepID=UPI00369B12B3